jgi:hypothetical protein
MVLNVQDRFQIQMRSMEEFIDKENALRFLDAFVEELELDKLGFHTVNIKRVEICSIEIKKTPFQLKSQYLKITFKPKI